MQKGFSCISINHLVRLGVNGCQSFLLCMAMYALLIHTVLSNAVLTQWYSGTRMQIGRTFDSL